MSEKGQKIFKICVWTVILLLLAGLLGLGIYRTFHPYITQEHWLAMLQQCLGKPVACSQEQRTAKADGSFAALSAFDMMGEERLRRMSEIPYGAMAQEEKEKLAVQLGMVSGDQLKKNLKKEEADRILERAAELYCSPEYFPQYYEAEYEENVWDPSQVAVSRCSSDFGEMTLSVAQGAPEVGQVVFARNVFGVAVPRRLTAVQKEGDQYHVQTEAVPEDEEVVHSTSFSGAVDFSYFLKHLQADQNAGAAGVLPVVHAADDSDEGHGTTDNIKLEIELKGSSEQEKGDNPLTIRVNNVIIQPSNMERINDAIYDALTDARKKYEAEKAEAEKNQDSHKEDDKKEDTQDADKDDNKKEDKTDPGKIEPDGEVSIALKLTLDKLSMTADGKWRMIGEDYANAYINVDPSVELDIKNRIDLSLRLFTLNLPVAGTFGIVNVDVNVYLIMGTDGSFHMAYSISNLRTGAEISSEKGFTPVFSIGGQNTNVSAQAKAYGGVRVEGAVNLVKRKLADPCAELRGEAEFRMLPVVEGYEDLPPCSEVKAYAPVIEFRGHRDEKTIAFDILDGLGWADQDFVYLISPKDAYEHFYGRKIHIEIDKDGKLTMPPKCTHEEKEEEEEEEEDAEKKRQLEQALTQWIDMIPVPDDLKPPSWNPELHDPTAPDPQNPSDPGSQNPSDPGSQNPSDPGSQNPSDPGSQNPSDPGSQNPSDPGSQNPSDPGSETPQDPNRPRPLNPGGYNPFFPIPQNPEDRPALLPSMPDFNNPLDVLRQKIEQKKQDLQDKLEDKRENFEEAVEDLIEDTLAKLIQDSCNAACY